MYAPEHPPEPPLPVQRNEHGSKALELVAAGFLQISLVDRLQSLKVTYKIFEVARLLNKNWEELKSNNPF